MALTNGAFDSQFILLRALNDFLLVGNAWPYAAIQNLIFGFFAAIKFVLGVVRERTRMRKKALRARAEEERPRPGSEGSSEARRKSSSARRTRFGALSRGRRGERASPRQMEISAPQPREPELSGVARAHGVTQDHVREARAAGRRRGGQ